MIALPAQVTFEHASSVMEDASRAVQAALRPSAAGATAPAVLDIDLAACGEFDSSLLAVLLQLCREATAGGARCRLLNVPAKLRQLALLYGVDALLFASSGSPADAQPA